MLGPSLKGGYLPALGKQCHPLSWLVFVSVAGGHKEGVFTLCHVLVFAPELLLPLVLTVSPGQLVRLQATPGFASCLVLALP